MMAKHIKYRPVSPPFSASFLSTLVNRRVVFAGDTVVRSGGTPLTDMFASGTVTEIVSAGDKMVLLVRRDDECGSLVRIPSDALLGVVDQTSSS